MPLVRTVTGRDVPLTGLATSLTAGAAATLTAIASHFGSHFRFLPPPPPPVAYPWRLVPAAARSLVGQRLQSNAASLLLGAAVGTAAGAVLLLAHIDRRTRKPWRSRRSAMLEALADEANATAAQPLCSPTQRGVLLQLLRSFDLSPFAPEAPAEARAAALLLARVHARLALSRLASAESHGLAAQPRGRSASSVGAGGGGSELTSESCKVCWEAKCNTLYTPCGHVVACLGCTAKLRRLACPVCQGRIGDVIQLFTT